MVETHVFRINDGKMEFLLLKRAEGDIYPFMWQMVTGRVEENEKAFNTALREVLEETSMKVLELWTVSNINSFYSAAADALNFIIVFAARVDTGAATRISPEHIEFKWVDYGEYFETLVWEGQKKSASILFDYYNNRKNDLDLVKVEFEKQ
jgi:dATP pyrophosphohydrolase